MNTKEEKMVNDDILLAHLFQAPIDLVFQAWTHPEHLAQWFAPAGCSIHYEKIDVRPGGTYHSCIHHPIHGDCWCIGTYLEVTVPHRLVYTCNLADAKGNPVTAEAAGKPTDQPHETIIILEFAQQGDQTLLTLRQNMSTALAKQTGAYQSWISMFEQLDHWLVRP